VQYIVSGMQRRVIHFLIDHVPNNHMDDFNTSSTLLSLLIFFLFFHTYEGFLFIHVFLVHSIVLNYFCCIVPKETFFILYE
jgi:hypothetical protein